MCYPVASYMRADRGELGGDLLKSGRILKAKTELQGLWRPTLKHFLR